MVVSSVLTVLLVAELDGHITSSQLHGHVRIEGVGIALAFAESSGGTHTGVKFVQSISKLSRRLTRLTGE